MGRPDVAALLPLAESIADGSAIDWNGVEARASADDQAMIRQLRILAALATLHRTLPADPSTLPNMFAARRASAAPATGRWAQLDLIERIGGGTYGEVYRAWDRHLEREVALKLLRADEAVADPQASRIIAEGRLLARVRHLNVVTVHGVAVHDGRVGLWMELVHGATLEQVLSKQGPFSAREATLVGIDLCRALAALHKARLIHRDVKAQNVLREDGGRIVLMDLGTGREITPGGREALPDLAGTPLYLAPELFEGEPASERTDLFSLGVLLYHLVTGSFPVRAATIDELKAAHARRERTRLRDARPDLPTAFVHVVDRAIASDPSERYASAGALEADLVKALDDTVTPTGPPATGLDGQAPRHRRWRANLVGLAAAVAVLVALSWSLLSGRKPPSVGPGAIRSIAVLPLVNFSGDPAQESFADGMTDELIGTLGQLEGVNVISRTSMMQFKGSTKPLPAIARALNVDAILEGSVRVIAREATTEGDRPKRVRINARLIYAGSDTQLWDRTFEHVLTDVLALQSEVAAAVAQDIGSRLKPVANLQRRGSTPRNAETQDAYLEGRSYLTNSSRESLQKARTALERAVTLDPDYARAHAALAVCYVWLEQVGVLPQDEARSLALDAAKRALELDPNLPEAHGAIADLELYDWNWRSADDAYHRALSLNPNYTFARRNYAWYLAAAGRVGDALQQARLAQAADPLSADANGAVGMMLYFNRQYDSAIAELRKALAIDPSAAQIHNGLARAYSAKQSYNEAIAEIREAVRLSEDAPVYVAELARILAAAGDRTQARELLSGLQQARPQARRYVDPQVLGYVYAALGENDRAFTFLERAVSTHSPGIAWAAVDPRLDPVRQDARFVRLVRRIGLPPP